MVEVYVNGEKTKDTNLDRLKISAESRESIAKDIEAGNLESAIGSLLEVITGQSKKEILEEAKK